MRLLVNGDAQEVDATHLSDALEALGFKDAKVATAVNEVFVPATLRESHVLNDGDRVEIVAPRQGG